MSKGFSYILERFVWQPWTNDSSETCPPHGVFRVTSQSQVKIRGEKPSTTFGSLYGVNGDTAVKQGRTGKCCLGPMILALYDTGTPANGEGWGPKSGQWTLSKNYPATATISGVVNTTNKLVLANWGPITSLIGKADSSISKGSSGTVSIWTGAGGSESDTGINITAYALGAAITSAKWVTVQLINGVWYVGPWECP